MTREQEKLERSLGGIKDLGSIPDVIFVVDIGHEKNAVREAHTLQLPIIGVVDTNHSPEGIDYVIAGNDDSIRAIGYYAREIANAILEAKASIVETKAAVKKSAPAAKTEAASEEKKPAAKTEAASEEKRPAAKTEAPAEEKRPAAKTEAPAEEKKPAAKTEAPAKEKKPAAKKPAAKKPAAKKPAAKKADTE